MSFQHIEKNMILEIENKNLVENIVLIDWKLFARASGFRGKRFL